ncbi:MFS transporter [Loktanella sp. 3ANDIMAR09]|nr:MFS transporter [Loktanella sp. 3ANDIMAR09]
MASAEEMAASTPAAGTRFGLGRPALEAEVAAWDIDIRPDGQGLPVGSGDVWTGEEVYVENCAMCHGDFGEAVGRWPVLAGGWNTLEREDPVKTIGSYWPYLSTVYDYINRAMPFGNAQSLEPDEIYAITAYLLYLNNIVEDDFELSNETFLDVEMPNAGGFMPDDRPETELAVFSGDVCMENCKDSVEIVMRAAVLDVTPDSDEAEPTEAVAEAAAEIALSDGDVTEAGMADGTAGANDDMPAQVADAGMAQETAVEDAAVVAAADPELIAAGEGVFRACKACHAVGDGAANKSGPQLNNILDRPIGSVEGFRYSRIFDEAHTAGEVWTMEALTAFLANPREAMPGTKMSYRGIQDPADIDAVIAYLEDASAE